MEDTLIGKNIMEDKLNERLTSMEDMLNGGPPQRKTPQWKMTSMEDVITLISKSIL